jgi:microcystin-dependent protein
MDQYLAMILQFGGNFAPRQFALCNGQIIAIASNTALFSLLGTYYGGNGTSNFGLPDLRGRTAIGQTNTQAPGLSDYVIGEMIGSENVTMLTSNMPMHSHNLNAVAAVGNQTTPANMYLAEGPKTGTPPHQTSTNIYQSAAPNTPLNVQSVSVNLGGASIPMNIMQPFLTVTYIIATAGIFPPRN